jgi:hypothetical protein
MIRNVRLWKKRGEKWKYVLDLEVSCECDCCWSRPQDTTWENVGESAKNQQKMALALFNKKEKRKEPGTVGEPNQSNSCAN